MKKKGMAKGGKMKKGYAMGGAMTPEDGDKRMATNRAAQGMMSARGQGAAMGKFAKGGMMKKKGMAKGGKMKKGYAKGGKVMTYNLGGMVKSQVNNLKKK